MRGCTCPRDGARLCATCQAYAAREVRAPGVAQPAVPPPWSPKTPDPLQVLLTTLQDLAAQQDWHGWDQPTYSATGTDAGVQVLLWRGTDVVFALLKRDEERLTAWQTQDLASLKATGKVDVYVWMPKDLRQIAQRLGMATYKRSAT